MCANRWIDGPRRRDQSPSWVHRHLQRGGQRRYRTSHPGSGRRWEFPSGSADAPGDVDATVAAARELREEPGLTAGTLLLLDTLDVAPGMSSQQCRVFVATDLTHGVAQRELEEQDMRSAWFSRREIEGLICDGTISDVKCPSRATHARAAAPLRPRGFGYVRSGPTSTGGLSVNGVIRTPGSARGPHGPAPTGSRPRRRLSLRRPRGAIPGPGTAPAASGCRRPRGTCRRG